MATTATRVSFHTWDTACGTWASNIRSWDDFGPYAYVRADDERIHAEMDLQLTVCQRLLEEFHGVDAVSRRLDKSCMEHIESLEVYWDYIRYIFRVVEAVRLNSSNGKVYRKDVSDAFSMADSRTAVFHKLTRADIRFLDAALKAACFRRSVTEAIRTVPREENRVGGYFAEMAGVDGCRKGAVFPTLSEYVSCEDRQSHEALIRRFFAELADVMESSRNHTGGRYAEQTAVDDRFLKAVDGIIEEIAIHDHEMTSADFKRLVNQPIGYETFIPYVVGEYEYQKALVRIGVFPGSFGAEPAVYNVIVHVDIDDTVDRGTAVITDTSAATTVRFSKHYYTKPEVTVTLRGGSTSDGAILPNVAAIDKDSFQVELLKSDGTRAKGTVTWQAVGY
mgnify:CR=1 FL=1